MTVIKLAIREIGFRKGSFLAGVIAVAIAICCALASIASLRFSADETSRILAKKQHDVELAGAELEDSMRKITKGLGFNVFILPEDQDLNELYLQQTASSNMPESHVHRLAESDIVTVNHLLPVVSKRITWQEFDLPIVVVGTRGEIPIMHRDPKAPLLDLVPEGEIVLGYQVHSRLELTEGDKVELLGREFSVAKLYPERGTLDDSTVWINLATAQSMFNMENLINGIWALECHCAGDRISQIRQEIAGILPGTQVIEIGAAALARAEARNTAAQEAKAALDREVAARDRLQEEQERFAASLVPIVTLASGACIGLLALGNVRHRRSEIGILRAIGLRSRQILGLFLLRSVTMGLVGGAVGILATWIAVLALTKMPSGDGAIAAIVGGDLLLAGIISAPLLAAVASWLPAVSAARHDPAVTLRED